ncbi:hypothetical protein BCR44DRAFT_1441404, partial [Catenaria anguillulae PL171]
YCRSASKRNKGEHEMFPSTVSDSQTSHARHVSATFLELPPDHHDQVCPTN